jgi:hypothetical protein
MSQSRGHIDPDDGMYRLVSVEQIEALRDAIAEAEDIAARISQSRGLRDA